MSLVNLCCFGFNLFEEYVSKLVRYSFLCLRLKKNWSKLVNGLELSRWFPAMVPCNAVLKHSLIFFSLGEFGVSGGDALRVSQKLLGGRKLLTPQLPALDVLLNLKSSVEIV